MFWNEYSGGSAVLGGLLDRDKFTLDELLEHDEVLQECKSLNKRLVDFLEERSTISALIGLTVTEPPDGCYRRPTLACEILACGLPRLIANLTADDALLAELFSFLDADPPLNPLLASFFSKTFQVLLTHQHQQDWYSYQISCLRVLEFAKSSPTFLARLLDHLGTSAVMDVVQCIVHIQVDDMRRDLLDWLHEQNFVARLVDAVCGNVDSEMSADSLELDRQLRPRTRSPDPRVFSCRSENASNLLTELITKGREAADYCATNKVDPLLKRCSEPSTVDYLLTSMFSTPIEMRQTAIINGIQILLALLNVAPGSPKPPSVDQNELNQIAEVIPPYFPNLHEVILQAPPNFEFGYSNSIAKPVGAIRLAVMQLIETLLHMDCPSVPQALVDSKIMPALLDMFVEYIWNNFLHAHVVMMIRKMFEATSYKELYNEHLFVECNLLDRVISAWEENDKSQEQNKPRHGYMGHLIQIANCVQDHLITYPDVMNKVSLESKEKWPLLICTKLDEINKVQNVYLGGQHPFHSSNVDHLSQQDFDNLKLKIQEVNFDDDDDNSDFAKQFKDSEQFFVFMCENASNSMGDEPLSSKYDHHWHEYGIFRTSQDDGGEESNSTPEVTSTLTFNSSSSWNNSAFPNRPNDWADFSCFENSENLSDVQKVGCDPFGVLGDLSLDEFPLSQADIDMKKLLSTDVDLSSEKLSECNSASNTEDSVLNDSEAPKPLRQINTLSQMVLENLQKVNSTEPEVQVNIPSSEPIPYCVDDLVISQQKSEYNSADFGESSKLNDLDCELPLETNLGVSDGTNVTEAVVVVDKPETPLENNFSDSEEGIINEKHVNMLGSLLQKMNIISKAEPLKEDLSIDGLVEKILNANESFDRLGELIANYTAASEPLEGNINSDPETSQTGKNLHKLTPDELSLCIKLKEHISENRSKPVRTDCNEKTIKNE